MNYISSGLIFPNSFSNSRYINGSFKSIKSYRHRRQINPHAQLQHRPFRAAKTSYRSSLVSQRTGSFVSQKNPAWATVSTGFPNPEIRKWCDPPIWFGLMVCNDFEGTDKS